MGHESEKMRRFLRWMKPGRFYLAAYNAPTLVAMFKAGYVWYDNERWSLTPKGIEAREAELERK